MSAAAEAVDPTIKQIKVTGAAAESLSPKSYDDSGSATKGGARRGGQSRKKVQKFTLTKEGGGVSAGTLQQLAASHIPGSDSSKAVGATSELTNSGAAVGKLAPAASADPAAPPVVKGGATQRVILAKSRKKSKVLLAAPKHSKPLSAATATPMPKKRKTAKKVHVSLTGLGKKMRNAKTIRNKASKHTLDEVKAELVKAGLIKADSKAPEPILRQMYADFMVLKKRAL